MQDMQNRKKERERNKGRKKKEKEKTRKKNVDFGKNREGDRNEERATCREEKKSVFK
jgi:hypothetical protein